jgi:hypothetical protein
MESEGKSTCTVVELCLTCCSVVDSRGQASDGFTKTGASWSRMESEGKSTCTDVE